MLFSRSSRTKNSEEVAPLERVRRVGLSDTYEGVDGDEVIRRLRNMNYGSTSNRIAKLRESSITHEDPEPTLAHAAAVDSRARGWMLRRDGLDPAV